MKQKYTRASGVLLPVTTLHGPFGIGVMGREAMEFIDFLSDSGFHAWQILPLEHTGAGNSPYKCVSAFAGEPMLIDPRELLEMGLITQAELDERASGISADFVDYGAVYEKQRKLLRTAFSRLEGTPYSKFKPFWLENYAVYMAIKRHFEDQAWYTWPDEALRSCEESAVKAAKSTFKEDVDFYKFVQWLFWKQWKEILKYAAKRKVTIIGDMPFYVSEDSAEVWSRRDLFDADEDGNFAAIGGAPPDYFAPDGQRWGNPVYNWKLIKKEGYKWWIDRMREAMSRYNMIRLDHFRGFESYWSIPAEDETARNGKWVRGPGMQLFKAMAEELGELPVIAEDLGIVGEEVEKLLEKSGFRGMRVLQFGFHGDGRHLPHGFSEDCIAFTGTHDNTTLLGWMFDLPAQDRERALFYLGFNGDWTAGGPNCAINKAWIRALFMSSASIVIVPIQDLLGYGADTRFNTPGTPTGNWQFRIHDDSLGQIDGQFYKGLNMTFFRDYPLTEG